MSSELNKSTQTADARVSGDTTRHDSVLGAAGDLLHAAVYDGIQSPVNGITQLVDAVTNSDLEKHVQFISAPQQAKFGSLDWGAQTVGGAIGTVLPFMAADFGVKGVVGDGVSRSGLIGDGGLAAMLRTPIGSAATSGAVFGLVFEPSSDKSGANFAESRLANAATGAITFGSMSGVADFLHTKGLAAPGLAGKVLTNGAVDTALAGVPAGVIGAESNSLLNGKGLATGQDVAQSAASYALTGGLLGGLGAIGSRDTADSTYFGVPDKNSSSLLLAHDGRGEVPPATLPTADKPQSEPFDPMTLEPHDFAHYMLEQPTHKVESPDGGGIEVVAGAGGAKGIGLIGLYRYLEDQGVPIGTETGVSFGALMAAMHQRFDSHQMEEILKYEFANNENLRRLSQSYRPIAHPFRALQSHFVNGRTTMTDLVDRYELKPTDNLQMLAYNLTARKPILFTGENYDLAEALSASSALPLVMRPVWYSPGSKFLPDSMSQRGMLIDGGAWRMHPDDFAKGPAIIGQVSSPEAWPPFRLSGVRDIAKLPKLIVPGVGHLIEPHNFKDPGEEHFLVHLGHPSVKTLDLTADDETIYASIFHGYERAREGLEPHIQSGAIPSIRPVTTDTQIPEPDETLGEKGETGSWLDRLLNHLPGSSATELHGTT